MCPSRDKKIIRVKYHIMTTSDLLPSWKTNESKKGVKIAGCKKNEDNYINRQEHIVKSPGCKTGSQRLKMITVSIYSRKNNRKENAPPTHKTYSIIQSNHYPVINKYL